MAFFRSLDNTGMIKVNHISNDMIAAEMNLAGKLASASSTEASADRKIPPVTSPLFMGGYTYPILNDIAEDRMYQILKVELPQIAHPSTTKMIHDLIHEEEVVFSYVDAGELTVVQIEGFKRTLTPLSRRGWSFLAEAKTFKRLKTLCRPFRLWSKFSNHLKVMIVDDDYFTHMTSADLAEYTPDEIERLADGAFVISRRLFNDCLMNVKFPQFSEDDMRPELMVNFYRQTEYFNQAQYFHAFNARIFGPMDFVNLRDDDEDELWHNPGMLKGEAFLDVDGRCEAWDVDVVCTRSALKFAVSNDKEGYVLLEPQKAKRYGVKSDLQTMIDLPAVFQFEDVSSWSREDLLAGFEALKKDQIMEGWFDMSLPMFNSSKFFDQNDVENLTKWNVRAWLLSGCRITQSPWLFEQMGNGIAKTLRVTKPKKLRFPVPCAVRCQVISQTLASMAGDDTIVSVGSIHWSEECEALVVSDIDWLEMYPSHGGMDLDDFFNGYYRMMGGERKIIITRSPNDWGEYSIFDYIEGDWYPHFLGHMGNRMEFPEVSLDEGLWPPRLSEMIADDQIHYTGLPSEHKKEPKVEPHLYGPSDVMFLVMNNRASQTCVGANVNARALYSLTRGQHRPIQLTSMENCIDTGTQGGSFEDAEAVMAEAKGIVNELILDPSVKIDKYMWYSRFARTSELVMPHERLTDQTHISQAHNFRIGIERDFKARVKKYAQTQLAGNLDPRVHRLGLRFIRQAADILMKTRYQMVQMQQPQSQDLAPSDWNNVHALALNAILAFGNEEKISGSLVSDRHDFVLALYSACFKIATSTGRITDQLVMNPHIFPHLLEAMRFYGLARRLEVTPEGKLTAIADAVWDLECPSCHNERTTEDAMVWQAYNAVRGVCGVCRTATTQEEKPLVVGAGDVD